MNFDGARDCPQGVQMMFDRNSDASCAFKVADGEIREGIIRIGIVVRLHANRK